ncbi:LysM peptidoglycan-binding domain-containing protein [Paenibacillus sp. HWE-109]|uniref:LysM peptidoglycan-binding domain-containing protein n=1 Tax=Paenibacillus sp. HWE-109 TaxID=1306526 RepID=UPI001EE14312|nr:LysM peptidoglycan-binding domain-containing protein [Paenibacillus sp. HWE-109]UKS28994.1 LysM peptidoglycan-binding domain-containing protein [Paenibacillus sp. HWE-109]
MYMAYTNTTNSRTLHRSANTSKGMTFTSGYTKAIVRFVLLAIILGTVFSFGAIVQAYAGDPAATTTSTSLAKQAVIREVSSIVVPEKIVIQRGDTIWQIASLHKKNRENIRSYIDKIKAINHLTTSSLQEGQVLILPGS